MNLVETRPKCLHLVENHAIITQYPTGSRRVMYDDYDFDYASNDYSQDSDDYSQDLEEEYARDAQDYESLAYRHYA